MDSREIIQTIDAIYQRFHVMPSLQSHMKDVAKVGEKIAKNWTSPAIKLHFEDIIAALLLHDLGNIVKFILPDSETFWREIQEQIKEKYQSSVDHEVTKKMLKELGVSERLLFLIQEMTFENMLGALQSTDFDLKICTYSDLRVAPYGVVSVKERFEDLRKRYKGTPYLGRYTKEREAAALLLETQIFRYTSITPSQF